MPNIASWNPPAELLQLGEPDRAYWSRRISPRFLGITLALLLLVLGLEAGLIYVAAFTQVIPYAQQYLVYVLSALFLGLAGGLVANFSWWGSRRPNFYYAFHPSGLVMLTGKHWGFLSWRVVRYFETKYEEPLLVLEDRTQLVVVHDFVDPLDFYADLARYVEAKRRVLEDLPITASLVKYDKSTRRQLFVAAALLGITLAAGLVYFDWLDIVVTPNRTISHADLARVTSTEQLPRSWLTLECSKALPTSGQIVSHRQSLTFVDSKIVLIPVQDRFLVANVRNNWEPRGRIRGEVSAWKDLEGHPTDQRPGLLQRVADEFPQYRDRFLPVQLDATRPTETYAQVLALSLAIGFVVGLGLLCRGLWAARHSRPRISL